MSIWTHVSGIIRIDDYKMFGLSGQKTDLSKVFIRNTWFHRNENGNLPTGSEGSIDVEFIDRHEDDSTDYMRTVAFFGDLRDYEDLSLIQSWWRNIPNILPESCGIRQAVLLAECETGQRLILTEKEMDIKKDE